MADIWKLALDGFENNGNISLTHLIQGNERVVSTELNQLLREAGSPNFLSNLTLSAKQESPQREVLIQIGPGWNTLVTVEAEDHTWAIGRHTEIMERLGKTRKWYAPGNTRRSLSWPESRKKQPLTLKSFLQNLIAIPVALASAIIIYILSIFLIALTYLPTALLIQRIKHHQGIHFGAIFLEFLSAAIIIYIVYSTIKIIAAGVSKVIINREGFWSPNRIVLIGTIAGIVVAITSVLALFK